MQSVVAIIGWPEITGILIILLTMLGAAKIPDLLNGMRQGMQEFRQASRQVQNEVAEALRTRDPEDLGKQHRWHEFIFWLVVAIVVAMYAAALGLL